jgi:hypothetical protein
MIGAKMQNATYLFERPERYLKNSESRWTAIAQIALMYLSANEPAKELPVYKSCKDGYLNKEKDGFPISGFTFLNTVCECGLRKEIFGIQDFDNQFLHVKPDILYMDKDNKRVVFAEVKTLSESVSRNINLYDNLCTYLRGQGWKTDLYYLLSHGHEKKQDWSRLADKGSNIILWEDLFEVLAGSPIANLVGHSLGDYCERPAVR